MKSCLITIYTEGIGGPYAIENNIWGGVNKVGIDKIMDICDEYGAKALFFVDMAEGYAYGKEKIKAILTHIENRGHYTGVHIHPKHMANPEKDFLWQYTGEEQRKIINKCTVDYQKMTGHAADYFRAGKYGINNETLKLVQAEGYKIDFSYFSHKKWCHYTDAESINIPFLIGKLVEVPVTVFKMSSLGKIKRFEKLDVATIGNNEFKYVMKQIAKQPYDYPVTLFLHSFTFLDRKNPQNIKVDNAAIYRFRKMLEYVSNSDVFDFFDIAIKNFNASDYDNYAYGDCPSVKGKIRQIIYTLQVAWRIKHMNRKARCLLMFSFVIMLLLFAAIIVLIWRFIL